MTTTLTAAYVDDKINQQLPAEEDNSVVSRNTNNMPFHTVEPARNVVVYLNGDRFYPGRKFIVSKKQLHDFDGFLNEVTRGIKPSFGAVRNIYTPSQGHKVFGLEQIENNMALVAGGIERFRSIGYRDITLRPHMKHTTKKASMERIPPRNKLQVPGRWRTISNEPVQIFIHANGDILAPASKILLTPRQMKHWDLILQLITEKISNRTGKAVRKLYDMNYQMLFEPAALENGQSYIAVGSEKLKRLPYGSLGGNRSLRQISPRRANVPLPPIKPKPKTTKKIKRRSKPSESKVVIKASAATGFEPLVSTKPKPPVLPSVKQDSKEEEEESVFHAKPVLVKRQSPSLILQEDEDESNVFRANNGDQVVADEIKEDENTKVDVPIDQLPAEKVEEEIVVEASVKYTESVVETTQEDESVEQRSVENSIEKSISLSGELAEGSSESSESENTETDSKFSFPTKNIDFSARTHSIQCITPAAKSRLLSKRKSKKKETFLKKSKNFKKFSLAVIRDSLDVKKEDQDPSKGLNPWSRSYEFEADNLDSLSDS